LIFLCNSKTFSYSEFRFILAILIMQSVPLSLSWPWIWLWAAVVIFILLFFSDFLRVEKDKPRYKDLYWLSWCFVIAYMLHNFEEYWLDLTWNALGFTTVIGNLMNVEFSQSTVYIVNFSMVRLAMPLAAFLSHKNKWKYMATWAAWFLLVNWVWHIILSIVWKEYSPWLLTWILLFIPLAIRTYYLMIKSWMKKKFVIFNILWWLIYHLIMISICMPWLKLGWNTLLIDIVMGLDTIVIFYLWYRFQKYYLK